MGAFCCCSCGDDCEEYAYPSNSIYRHCICLRFFFYQLFTGYGALFHRLDGRPASQIQGASLSSTTTVTAISDNSAIETHVTMSRPVPYDAEQRYSRLQRDGLVSRRDKSVTHFQEETQPLRRNISSSDGESLGIGRKWNEVELEDDSKIAHLELSERSLAPKVAQGPNYIQPSAEEEDVCPTCLDGNFASNIHQKILKSQLAAHTIFILVVFMNGWKGVKVVQYVASWYIVIGNGVYVMRPFGAPSLFTYRTTLDFYLIRLDKERTNLSVDLNARREHVAMATTQPDLGRFDDTVCLLSRKGNKPSDQLTEAYTEPILFIASISGASS
ncbi:hypothetical protein Goshw_005172 [Gossypium schwendimanii]|uniref:Uncharacterized protein n=1 Tax=Gossypium schwendimanii TaxID=34291 RepID=A0A7J9MLP0_GOSSC|nr:hypothetical protein [Gossypium schwendimanii]